MERPLARALVPFVALARHIPLVVLSRAGRVIAVTEAAERLLGAGDLLDCLWRDVCSDPPARTHEYVEQCARTLAPIPGAFRIRVGEEHTRYRCQGYTTQIADESERAIVLHIRRRDGHDEFVLLSQKLEELNDEVLRRTRTERELAEAQARLTAILDQMPAGVMIAEAPSGRAVFSNAQARSIFSGAISADTSSEYGRVFTAWHADGREYASDDFPLVKALRGEVVSGQEVCFLRADGRKAVVRANAAPIRDERGTIVAAVTAYYDITPEKELEHATLVARAEAEAASRAKDEFLAMLGHELRNPLAPILIALQVMGLRGVGGEKERSIIERQVKHLARLVDDLLDVSRITNGKVELKREPVELHEVLGRAIEMASPTLEERAINLVIDVPSHGLLLDADAARLVQVMFNLVGNAAKYSERRGTVWIAGELHGEEVVCSVRDAGAGIAPEMLPRVFDWFVQEKQSVDRPQGGLGLGLAIVRNLVRLHGGTVTVDSRGKGHGSEFSVRLPLARAARARPQDEPTGAEVERLPMASRARVLVVDDNRDAANLLRDALAVAGHTVDVAYDGPSALRIAKQLRPRVAFLDLRLPVVDGYEVAAQLRSDPDHRDLRLVAITGYGGQIDRLRSRAAGFERHLAKPVDLDEVIALVRDWLCREPAGE